MSKRQHDIDNLLMIAKPAIRDDRTNELFILNAMIDTGAENSFIRQDVADELQLNKVQSDVEMNLILFGNETKSISVDQVETTLVDEHDKEFKCLMFTKKEITSPVKLQQLSEADKKFLKKRKISHSEQEEESDIHMILGIDLFFNVMLFEKPQYKLPSGLHLVPTIFGYIVCGAQNGSTTTRMNTVKEQNIDIERLWKLENIGINEEAEENNDNAVLEQFDKTVRMSPQGEITVNLPWKEGASKELGENYGVAYRRLFQLYESANKNPTVWKAICDGIEQQLASNIIEEAPVKSKNPIYYMVVTKLESNTTKHRVVYDASSHQKGKRSLNECLHPGPVILPESPGIIIRSRVSKQLMIADVEKPFHTIRLHEKDRDATRFLFLKNPNKPPHPDNLLILRFTRIPFGINSSPFQLGRSIQFYTDKSKASPVIKNAIHNDLYVDNLILSFDKASDLISLYHQSKKIFSDMSMNLREFASNCSQVSRIPKEDLNGQESQKVLGLKWNIRDDTYAIKKAQDIPDDVSITKRMAVRAMAETFDPLGLYSPIYGKFSFKISGSLELNGMKSFPRRCQTN